MSAPNLGKMLVPEFDVIIDGTPLSVVARVHAVEVLVDDNVDLPSMFSFSLAGSDDQGQPNPWVDDALFTVGKSVEIKMGYGNTLGSLIKGEITALEPEFAHDRLPTMTVRGYDRRHRLQRGRKTRTFVQQKDSAIASQIASEAGLSADATDTAVTHEYVVQSNMSDLDFLNERAHRIQFEVVVDDKKLMFRPVSNDKSAAFAMNLTDYLLEFSPRLSSLQQVTEVNVRGWSPKEKKEVLGTAKAGSETSTMGGTKTGSKLANDAFGAAADLLSELPVAVQAEADGIAKALLNKTSLSLIVADGVCLGRTDLRAGKVIKIEGIGSRFSGQYYVTSATHRFSPFEGYQTEFKVRRNAS